MPGEEVTIFSAEHYSLSSGFCQLAKVATLSRHTRSRRRFVWTFDTGCRVDDPHDR